MSRANSWSPEITAPRRANRAVSLREQASHLFRNALAAQRTALPWGLLAVLLAGTLLSMGAYVLAVTGQPLSVLVRDANAIAQQPNYFGALEHAGILLMSGAGWIAAFSSLLCRGQIARFLFLAGLLSLLLAADDLYMFHESSWRFGIDEIYVFALHALLLVVLVVSSLRAFLKTPFFLLGAALALFAIAVFMDANERAAGGIEDCLELVGICFWSVYFVKCSRDALLDRGTLRP